MERNEKCRFYETKFCDRYNPTYPECVIFAGEYANGKEAGCVRAAEEKKNNRGKRKEISNF